MAERTVMLVRIRLQVIRRLVRWRRVVVTRVLTSGVQCGLKSLGCLVSHK
jgi:hypothetical protein